MIVYNMTDKIITRLKPYLTLRTMSAGQLIPLLLQMAKITLKKFFDKNLKKNLNSVDKFQ